MAVFHRTIHILRMCLLRDCCSGSGGCSVTAWVLLSAGVHNTSVQNVCPCARSSGHPYCLIPYSPALPKSKRLLLCGFGECFCYVWQTHPGRGAKGRSKHHLTNRQCWWFTANPEFWGCGLTTHQVWICDLFCRTTCVSATWLGVLIHYELTSGTDSCYTYFLNLAWS